MLKAEDMKYLGIDIGGTKIEACTFDRDYNLISSEKYSLPRMPEKNLIPRINEIIERNFHKGIEKIGISLKCVINENKIKYFPLLGDETDIDLADDFAGKYNVPVFLENDVNCMAFAEYGFGKGKGVDNFLIVNLGTGLKTSLVYRGEIMRGFMDCAGELGQIKVIVPELGNKEVRYRNLICGRGVAGIYRELSGRKKDAREIFSAYDKDENSRKTVMIFTKYFARLLHDLSVYYNPELIVINGSLKKSADKFLEKSISLYKKETNKILQFRKIEVSDIDHAACLGSVI